MYILDFCQCIRSIGRVEFEVKREAEQLDLLLKKGWAEKRTVKRFAGNYGYDDDYNGDLDYLENYGYDYQDDCLIGNMLQMLCVEGVVEPCSCPQGRFCTVSKSHYY